MSDYRTAPLWNLECTVPSNCGVGEIGSVEQGNAIHQTAQGNKSDIDLANYPLDFGVGEAVKDGVIASGPRRVGSLMMLGIGLVVVVWDFFITAGGNGVKLLWIVVQRHCSTAVSTAGGGRAMEEGREREEGKGRLKGKDGFDSSPCIMSTAGQLQSCLPSTACVHPKL